MQYIYLFLQYNLVALLACLGLIIIMHLKSKIGMRNVIPLRAGIWVVLAMLVLEFIDAQMDIVGYGGPFRFIVSTLCYVLRPLECIFLIFQIKSSKKMHIFILLPWLIYIFLFIFNFPFHFIFYFDPDFHATGFGIIRIIIPFLYMLAVVVISITSIKQKETSEVVLVCILAASIIVATVFEWLDLYDASRKIIINPCVAVCYVFYYLFLHINASKRDPLTDLFNRQTFYDDSHIKAKDITGVISIDMNDLKYINDTFGHQAGDEALICISSIFKKNKKNKYRMYRVGGDEFIILCFGIKEEEIIEFVKILKKELSLTKYTCAFGYALIETNLKDAMLTADERMYQDKALTKTTEIR